MLYLKQNINIYIYIQIKSFPKLKQLLLPLLHTLKHLTKHTAVARPLCYHGSQHQDTLSAQNQSCMIFFSQEEEWYLQERRGGEEEPCWPLPFPKHGPCNTAATHRQEGNSVGILIPPGSLFACVYECVCHLLHWHSVCWHCVYCTGVCVCVRVVVSVKQQPFGSVFVFFKATLCQLWCSG